jgi:Flp pilus assembly pilin Flp
MRNLINRFRKDERGITMLEYGVMGAIIAAGLVLVVPLLIAKDGKSGAIFDAFTNIANSIK